MLHPPVTPLIESAADALAVTLHDVGFVDLDRIAELLGRTRDETIAELGERIFLDPQLTVEGIETWQTADAYLSGPIRTKLAAAIGATALDLRYRRNVEASKRFCPRFEALGHQRTPRRALDPRRRHRRLLREVLGVATYIHHTVEIASWSIDVNAFGRAPASTSTWGTERRHAGLLLSDALNSSLPQIYRRFRRRRRRKARPQRRRYRGREGQAPKIKAAFEAWIWTDADRTDRLARILQ